MEHGIVFDLDPNIVKLGPFDIPNLGFGVGGVLIVGYLIWLIGSIVKARKNKTSDPKFGSNAVVAGIIVGFVAWNVRDLTQFGPLQLRYYGLIFASMLYIGFILWRWQMVRGGYPLEVAERFLIWGVVGVLVGSRLGHCFFYEPERFLTDPIKILQVWKGGLSSHGATIGCVVTVLLFAKKYKLPYLETLDRFAMPASVGAAAVRLGNFFNSEIVGRATDLPWAVRFMRHDNGAVARHPSQLYEFTFGLFVLLVLYVADRVAGREKRPVGLLSGLFLTVYFTGRFLVEFVKEYQVDALIEGHSSLTMGQYLSILPFACGVGLLLYAKKRGPRSEVVPGNPHSEEADSVPSSPRKATKKKSKKKRK